MRSATGGLAAMLMSTPDAMSSSTALSRSLSTVNHQLASKPRSLRLMSMTASSLGHGHPGQARHGAHEGIAANFEIGIMIE